VEDTAKGTRIRVIEDEMKQAYLDYSMSVIVGRALPDSRDGLKPVHRRILFAMKELGMLHTKPFKKSARVVGEVLGKYHPHGDLAVYDALVRMVQDFSLRYPLVQGQGNFGSVDGDNPAAMRYTEVRLSKIAEELLEDIDKETVSFVPNFDGTGEEPVVLPSKIPNLLVNGSSGIAVGMATSIPPHNLSEVVDAAVALIDNPEASLQQLMSIVKGPDFPTGGIIRGRNGILQAYTEGRGNITVRAKTAIEQMKDRQAIIVTEIPFQVNKSVLIEEIAELVKDKHISGISDLRDESDREGMRIVIELKKDAIAEVVQNQLFAHSRLESGFSIMMVCLVNNQPRTLSLGQMLKEFIKHRQVVVRKRTDFELKKAAEQAHMLEGLIKALNSLDAVIKLIRASRDPATARQGLVGEFALSEIQAQAILDMKLQRLSNLEQEKIRAEHKSLLAEISKLKEILASELKILGIIREELIEMKQAYGDKRRTDFMEGDVEVFDEDLIEDKDCVVTVTRSGYVKRVPLDVYKEQRRGGKGIIGTETREEDVAEKIFVCRTKSTLLCFTDTGMVHWLKVYEMPEASRQSLGKAIVNLLSIEGQKITAVIAVREFDDLHYLIMASRKGVVKKIRLDAFSRPRKGGIIAVLLDEDNLINVALTSGESEVILATRKGMAVRFYESHLRATGRNSHGVRGIRLGQDDEVIGMVTASSNENLLSITENGYGKRTSIADYRLVNRGSKGVINIKADQANGNVVSIITASDTDSLLLITKQGIIIRTPAKDISVIGRNTKGVRIIRLDEEDTLVSVAKVESDLA